MQPFTLCLKVAFLVLASALSARAISGTDIIARKGEKVAVEAEWPRGLEQLVNHRLRTSGWQPWFSEGPNDVRHFAFQVQTMNEVNELLRLLNDVRAEGVSVRLNPAAEPGPSGVTTVIKKGNGLGALLSFGSQRRLDAWFHQLEQAAGRTNASKATGEKKFGVHRLNQPPKALPPTLTLFVAHPGVDLRRLQVPLNLTVASDVPETARAANPLPAAVQAIDAWQKARATSSKPAPRP